jgi:hypothetical protein
MQIITKARRNGYTQISHSFGRRKVLSLWITVTGLLNYLFPSPVSYNSMN